MAACYGEPPHASTDITRRDFAAIAAKAFALAVGVPGMDVVAGRAEGVVFADALGRDVRIDGSVTSVSPLGIGAQAMITALVPNGLASVALDVKGDEEAYDDAGLAGVSGLPESGALNMASADPVSEAAIGSVKPDLLIDAGVPRDGLAEELDELQRVTGVPCVFLDIGFGKLPDAYRLLGRLLFCESRAEELAVFVESALDMAREVASRSGKSCRALYAPRRDGLSVRSGIEVQLDAMRHVGVEPVTDAYDMDARTVDPVRAAESDPDLVVFGSSASLESLLAKEGSAFEAWGRVPAVAQGRFVVCPTLMHSWFGSMVLVQSLGVLWLARVVFPDACDYDLVGQAGDFYRLFYGLDRTAEELIGLVGGYDGRGYAAE